MTRTIIATKSFNGKIVERKFTEFNWNLVGADKNGWVEKTDQNIIASIPLPPKGETIKIEAEIKAPIIVVTEVHQDIKDAFMNNVSKLSKGVIKDYFDKEKIEYSNALSIIDLRIKLGTAMNYNVDLFNTSFNDSKK